MRNPIERFRKRFASDKVRIMKDHDVQAAVTVKGADPSSPPDGIEGKLLVMGRESTFSKEVVDYAIDMARRMSFEILALNSAPLSGDAFGLFSTSRSKLCEEFHAISARNAIAFRDAAQAKGVAFTHIVKFDEPDQALANVQKEYRDIEFVISDVQSPSVVDRASVSNRPRCEVQVYSMI